MESRQTTATYKHLLPVAPLGGNVQRQQHNYHQHQHNYHPYQRSISPAQQSLMTLELTPAAPPHIKGKRKRASPHQLKVLNDIYLKTAFPSTETRNRLARELGMTPRTVQIWFQNKRQASRQRDGHHSRNTKSMAASMANVNSFGRQYTKSLSPSSSHSPSPVAVPNMLLANSTGSDSLGHSSNSPRAQQLMALVEAAATAPAQPATSPSAAVARTLLPSWAERTSKPAGYLDSAYNPRFGANAGSSGGEANPEYAHTRNDQWFTEDTPSRLEYLYSHNSQVVMVPPRAGTERLSMSSGAAAAKDVGVGSIALRPPSSSFSSPHRPAVVNRPSTHQLAPLPQWAGVPVNFGERSPNCGYLPSAVSSHQLGTQTQRKVSVQRSMSLMDLLNAPPEHRKLPPLPPIAP